MNTQCAFLLFAVGAGWFKRGPMQINNTLPELFLLQVKGMRC